MDWEKKGLIFEPDYDRDWMVTHSQLPVADRVDDDGDRYRIYFSGRNDDNMSQIGYVEVDIDQPREELFVTPEPVVELGPLGTFDDSGVYPSSIVSHGGRKYLYYIGWMQGKRVPYYACVGLAVSDDGGESFEKVSKAPLLPRNSVDPYMTLSSDAGIYEGIWKMWYTSATKWELNGGKPKPYYHIKYAESDDGIEWKREGKVSIDYEYDDEWAIARPCVLRDDGLYRMWYCYSRGDEGYRIGYAESDDGVKWERMDGSAGIEVSESGWDSELIAYPYVFEHDGTKYMLYNGNDFGKNGFGLAKINS